MRLNVAAAPAAEIFQYVRVGGCEGRAGVGADIHVKRVADAIYVEGASRQVADAAAGQSQLVLALKIDEPTVGSILGQRILLGSCRRRVEVLEDLLNGGDVGSAVDIRQLAAQCG